MAYGQPTTEYVPEPVFVIYPETYNILKAHRNDKDLSKEARLRIIGIMASWEAAQEDRGSDLQRVMVYLEDGNLTFRACSNPGWTGELGSEESDEDVEDDEESDDSQH